MEIVDTEQLTEWISTCRKQAQAAMMNNDTDRGWAIFSMTEELRKWLEAGRPGDMPLDQARRRELGLPSIGDNDDAEAPQQAAPITTDLLLLQKDSGEPAPLQSLELATNAGKATEIADTAMETIHQDPNPTRRLKDDEIPPAPEPPDPQLQQRYDEAQSFLKARNYIRARQILAEIGDQAQGSLREQISSALAEASRKQQEQEQQAVQTAETVDREHPDDLDKRRESWLSARNTAEPGSEVYRRAEQALVFLEKEQEQRRILQEEQELRKRLQELQQERYTAEQTNQISQIQGFILELEALDSHPWSEESKNAIADVLVEIRKALANVREKTQDVPTLLKNEEAELAYREAYRHGEQGTAEIWDADLGRGIPISEVLNTAIEKLLEFRKAKAQERILSARKLRDQGAPQRALDFYADALSLLTYLDLETDPPDALRNKREVYKITGGTNPLPKLGGVDALAAARTDVATELQEAQELYALWQETTKQFEAAQREPDPQQALRLLHSVQTKVQQHANLHLIGLEEAIARRESDLAAEITATLESTLSEAGAAAQRNEFEKARNLLGIARQKAATVQQPPPALVDVLQRLTTLTSDIDAREKRSIEINEILGAAEAALAIRPPAIDSARDLLERLHDGERGSQRALNVQGMIATLQGEQANWNDAQTRYRESNWQATCNSCEQIIKQDGSLRSAAEQLQSRARAMLELEKAHTSLEAMPARLKEAHQAYSTILKLLKVYGTDSQTEAAQQEAQEFENKWTELSKNDGELHPVVASIRSALNTERQVMSAEPDGNLALRPRWKELHEQLKPILQRPSTLKADIEQLRTELFDLWRKDYLDRALATPRSSVTYSPLHQLMKELRDNALFWDPKEQRLDREIELDYLLEQANSLRRQKMVRWEQITQLEQRIVELMQLGYRPSNGSIDLPQVEQRFREARVEQIRSTVKHLRDTDKPEDLEAAIGELEKHIAAADFGGDIDLIIDQITIYQHLGRFPDAIRKARSLSRANIDNAKELGRLWEGLTLAAELFQANDYTAAITQIEHSRKLFPDGEEYIKNWLEDRIERAIEILLRQIYIAQQAKDTLTAIQKCAQARMLLELVERNDARIDQQIKKLSKPIIDDINTATEEVVNISKLDGRDPQVVLPKAQAQYVRLKAIESVQQDLGLSQDLQADLHRTMEDLEGRIRRWDQGSKKLKQAQDIFEQARQEAWNFAEAKRLANEVRRDEDFKRRATELAEQIEECDRYATALQPLITALESSIRKEEFAKAITACDNINDLWSKMLREIDPALDEEGLRKQKGMQHTYIDLGGRKADSWREHRKIAEEQRQNYESWRDYVVELQKLDQRARMGFKDVEQSLEDQMKALSELLTDLRQCQIAYAELEGKLGQREQIPAPLSNLAMLEKQKADQIQSPNKRTVELNSWKERTAKHITECEAKQKEIDELVKALSQKMYASSFSASKPNNDLLERQIQEIANRDPFCNDLPALRERLEKRRIEEKNPRKRFWNI